MIYKNFIGPILITSVVALTFMPAQEAIASDTMLDADAKTEKNGNKGQVYLVRENSHNNTQIDLDLPQVFCEPAEHEGIYIDLLQDGRMDYRGGYDKGQPQGYFLTYRDYRATVGLLSFDIFKVLQDADNKLVNTLIEKFNAKGKSPAGKNCRIRPFILILSQIFFNENTSKLSEDCCALIQSAINGFDSPHDEIIKAKYKILMKGLREYKTNKREITLESPILKGFEQKKFLVRTKEEKEEYEKLMKVLECTIWQGEQQQALPHFPTRQPQQSFPKQVPHHYPMYGIQHQQQALHHFQAKQPQQSFPQQAPHHLQTRQPQQPFPQQFNQPQHPMCGIQHQQQAQQSVETRQNVPMTTFELYEFQQFQRFKRHEKQQLEYKYEQLMQQVQQDILHPNDWIYDSTNAKDATPEEVQLYEELRIKLDKLKDKIDRDAYECAALNIEHAEILHKNNIEICEELFTSKLTFSKKFRGVVLHGAYDDANLEQRAHNIYQTLRFVWDALIQENKEELFILFFRNAFRSNDIQSSDSQSCLEGKIMAVDTWYQNNKHLFLNGALTPDEKIKQKTVSENISEMLEGVKAALLDKEAKDGPITLEQIKENLKNFVGLL
jgi:hypothetical protein